LFALTLNPNKLSPIFSEKFEGIIWKVEVNEKYNLIAIESRTFESKKTSFSVINYRTGEISLKEKTFKDLWNLNLAYVTENNLIITAFNDVGSPESKGIISVNFQDNQVLWEHYNLSLNSVNDDGLQVYDPRINPRRLSWISHLKGESITDCLQKDQSKASILLPEFNNQFLIPDFISREEIVGDLSVLDVRGLKIISFHEKNQNNIQQRLLVYQDDTILLDEILIRDIQKLQPESFFMEKNHLFYIRNKNEIVSYFV
jgi:hypothetical protein